MSVLFEMVGSLGREVTEDWRDVSFRRLWRRGGAGERGVHFGIVRMEDGGGGCCDVLFVVER